ncbi:UNVERIFIED_CONTAM: hypothetical protein B566_EDAN017742 [Ephemera danica]|nr:hypothetical protein B566_EDAN017742 [Ephemera danica]
MVSRKIHLFQLLIFLLLIMDLINARSTSLELKCERPGMNPYPSDCHYFVLCVESSTEGLKYVAVINCPPEQAFSKQHFACVNNTQLPEQCPLEERSKMLPRDSMEIPNNLDLLGDKPVTELCPHGIGTHCHGPSNEIVFCSIIDNKLTVFLAASCAKIDVGTMSRMRVISVIMATMGEMETVGKMATMGEMETVGKMETVGRTMIGLKNYQTTTNYNDYHTATNYNDHQTNNYNDQTDYDYQTDYNYI